MWTYLYTDMYTHSYNFKINPFLKKKKIVNLHMLGPFLELI